MTEKAGTGPFYPFRDFPRPTHPFRTFQDALDKHLGLAPYVALEDGIAGLDGRHPGTQHFGPLFAFGHLPEGPARDASEVHAELAATAIAALPDGPELAAGLRKLLEAKDCFVRAAVSAPGTTA